MQLKIPQLDYIHLARQIKLWGEELGFQQVAITDIDLKKTGEKLNKWLESGYQGNMDWMAAHGEKRYHPEQLVPGAKSVISVTLNYFPEIEQDLNTPKISKYAYGRDYHKVVRGKLKRMLNGIQAQIGLM